MRARTATALIPGERGQLDIRLFGHATITLDGVPVKFAKRSTTLAMIAYLVLKRGQPVSREALAYLMFPEADEATALAELRRYLYRANKSLTSPVPWIAVDTETVRWSAEGGAFVDVLEFDRLSADPHGWERAAELYTGDLLADIYEDWVLAERELLRSRYLALLKNYSISTVPIAASKAPSGMRNAFFSRIRGAKTPYASSLRFATNRAIRPLRWPSTKALRNGCATSSTSPRCPRRRPAPIDLRNEAVPGSLNAPAGTPSAAAPRIRAGFPFVGRERELERLQAVWTRAARGSGSLVLLRGEAGVGKTRLVSEFARKVQSEGGRVFTGTTSMPELMPYQAIAEALRSALPLLQARPPDAGRRAIWRSSFPKYATRPFPRSYPPSGPRIRRPRAFTTHCAMPSIVSHRLDRCCSFSKISIGPGRQRPKPSAQSSGKSGPHPC